MLPLVIWSPDESPAAEQGTPAHLPAEVLVKRRKRVRGGGEAWEVVRARGHLDEVQELRTAAPQSAPRAAPPRLHLLNAAHCRVHAQMRRSCACLIREACLLPCLQCA